MKLLSSELHLLPERKNFVAKYNISKDITFLCNDVREHIIFGRFNLLLVGVLPNGAKASVLVDDIIPYIDIDIHSLRCYDGDVDKCVNLLIEMITSIPKDKSSNVEVEDYEVIKMQRLHGFEINKRDYLRVYFKLVSNRRRVLTYLNKESYNKTVFGNILTASDDIEFLSIVLRKYKFSTCGWNKITDALMMSARETTNTQYEFYCSILSIKALPEEEIVGELTRPKVMVASWDIEVRGNEGFSSLGEHDKTHEYKIFMIGTAFFWQHSDKPLFTVCFTDTECDEKEGIDYIVICKNEMDIIYSTMELWRRMMADINISFNGSGYDWLRLIEKLNKEGRSPKDTVLLKEKLSCIKPQKANNGFPGDTNLRVYRDLMRQTRVKLSAGALPFNGVFPKLPGMVVLDVMVSFMKMYAKNAVSQKHSLNFFLEVCKLDSKEPMGYNHMLNIYKRSELIKAEEYTKNCHCGEEAEAKKCKLCGYNRLLDDDASKCCHCNNKVEKNHKDMADVAYYCIVDCIRPQQLMLAKNVYGDKRELGSMSFTSFFDACYRADGGRVRSFLGSYCESFGVAFTQKANKHGDKPRYPGAYVFTPERGLHDDYPITGLDFESLYPNILRTFNLSPDMIVSDPDYAEELRKLGYKLHTIPEFTYTINKGKIKLKHPVSWSVLHNGVIRGDETAIIERYEENENGEMIPVYGRAPLQNERMGMGAYVVSEIFDKRIPIKRRFVALDDECKEIEIKMQKASGEEYEKLAELLESKKLERDLVEAKQRALKILANTFYGECGNHNSSIYNLSVAYGVTKGGKDNIKAVANFARERGFHIKYGDTDSLYLQANKSIYADIEAETIAALKEANIEISAETDLRNSFKELIAAGDNKVVKYREEYWTKLVNRTFEVLKKLQIDINNLMVRLSNGRFLRMALEEVGFPTFMAGKKKYFMTPHAEGKINFYPNDIFIRGIEIVKRHISGSTVSTVNKMMKDILSPANYKDVIVHVDDTINDFYNLYKTTPRENYGIFAEMAKYNPAKKNIKVLTFIQRMREIIESTDNEKIKELYELPEPGDGFKYLMVKRPGIISSTGTVKELSVGEKMEFLHVVMQDETMELDYDHYIAKIFGIMARFICYLDQFYNKAEHEKILAKYDDEDTIMQELDKSNMKFAKKYLENKHMSKTPSTMKTERRQAKKNIDNSILNLATDYIGGDSLNLNNNMQFYTVYALLKKVTTNINSKLTAEAIKKAEKFGDGITLPEEINIAKLDKAYYSKYIIKKIAGYNKALVLIKRDLSTTCASIARLLLCREGLLQEVMMNCELDRLQEELKNRGYGYSGLTEEDYDALNKECNRLNNLLFRLGSTIYLLRVANYNKESVARSNLSESKKEEMDINAIIDELTKTRMEEHRNILNSFKIV